MDSSFGGKMVMLLFISGALQINEPDYKRRRFLASLYSEMPDMIIAERFPFDLESSRGLKREFNPVL